MSLFRRPKAAATDASRDEAGVEDASDMIATIRQMPPGETFTLCMRAASDLDPTVTDLTAVFDESAYTLPVPIERIGPVRCSTDGREGLTFLWQLEALMRTTARDHCPTKEKT